MDDQILIGGESNSAYHYWSDDDLLAPIGAPPEFSEPIEIVQARIAETIGHVTVAHKVQNWHPAIERLLKDDEKRREKQLADPIRCRGTNPSLTRHSKAGGFGF